ncbi:hypothetical protein ACLESO_53845 [Pyxidicoccus sp. 3LG]
MSAFPAAKSSLFVFVFLVGLLGAGEALAQDRWCMLPAATTGRTCDEATCLTMQAAINLICKQPAPYSCDRISGCTALQAMRTHWQSCLDSRLAFHAACFPVPNAGHAIIIQQTRDSIAKCTARIALPQPVGCADDCPP